MTKQPELIPIGVRFAVRDAVGGWGRYTTAQIGELFIAEGFAPGPEPSEAVGGARRTEANRFQDRIDFSSHEQVDRYLRVVERILDDHGDGDGQQTRATLLKALARAGIEPGPDGRLRLPAPRSMVSPTLSQMTTESDIRLHAQRLERLGQEPEEVIGAAKELVEATAKFVLISIGETVGDREDVPGLSKRALTRLRLHPEAVAPTVKGAEIMTRMLGGLAQVAAGLAELRNMGYGTGHGQGQRVAGLMQRHAEFAARCAVAYATFVLDTLHDERAPWRGPIDDGSEVPT